MEEKRKMSKWLKIILIILGAIILIGIFASLGDEDQTDQNNETEETTLEETTESQTETKELETDEVVEETTEQQTEEETVEQETDQVAQSKYKASTYKVGTDIPAGEYVVFAESAFGGYLEVASNSSGELDSIITNENFTYNSIITVDEGQYFKMTGAYAVPIDEVESLDTSGDGMFKVGVHLPPGEYKLTVTDTTMGFGYYEVAKDSTQVIDSIVTNENFEADTYITVLEGQYLTLTSCKIIQ